MDEIRGNESVVRMRTIVQGWLASEDWTTTQLIDWFQGYNLPAVGHDEEPYLWLLRGVPEADERHAAEKKFTGRAAMLLKEKPDVKRPGKRPDQALYNLFMLCAGLSCPDELADPLFRVFERRQLKGKWRGIDIRSALKSALISNQKDSRVFASWEKLLLNGKNEFFTVDEFEFLDAARLMPESEDKRGEPALNAIGKAFKMMASKLEPDHERRIRYRSIVNKVIETYPGRPTWNLDLLRQADGNVWPIWSIECLPSLYVPILDNGSSDRTLTWHYLVSCIPWPLNYRVVGSMCQEQVFELEMADTTAEFVESIAPVFERNRL